MEIRKILDIVIKHIFILSFLNMIDYLMMQRTNDVSHWTLSLI